MDGVRGDNVSADVVVIGAGAVGSSVAFQMAEAGLKVILVDKGFPGGGTSKTTQAGIGVYPKKPSINLQLNMKGGELYPALVARLEADVELEMNGVLDVALSDEDLIKIKAVVARQLETPGYTARVISGDEARAMEPALSTEIVGAAFCPLNSQINPFLYVQALTRGLERCGGEVRPGVAVSAISRSGQSGWSVSTNEGTLLSQWVVNCAGIHAPEIGRMVGIDIPIVPNKGHVLITEALPPVIRISLSGPTLIRQTVHGNMLLGQSQELAGFDRSENFARMAAQAHIAHRLLPCLVDRKVIRSFVGLRPWPPDGMPILGKVPGLDGFLVAVGHSGVTWSPAVGKLLTEVVTGKETTLPLELFSITRFAGRNKPAVE
jgi:glycine/D-amino acid oxidase-like deaminating enzyme